jgi:hypothetical protein
VGKIVALIYQNLMIQFLGDINNGKKKGGKVIPALIF